MSTLDVSSEKLGREREELERALEKLDAERAQILRRLDDIAQYFEVVARLTGNKGANDERAVQVSARVADGKKRIRSTRLLAGVVVGSKRKWTKEQVVDAFIERFGMPDWENPTNAFGTALARAVDHGMIGFANGLYFDPDEAR